MIDQMPVPQTSPFISSAGHNSSRRIPGDTFGATPESPRPLDSGMGMAVARRTVFRPSDNEDMGRVADRVAAGNMGLLKRPLTLDEQLEQIRLRNAIASGALPTSGRHLQQGDETQHTRDIGVFSNCATAIVSFGKFYLLLSGAGVGRSYDDELMIVNWTDAPRLLFHLSKEHPDYPHTEAQKCHLGVMLNLLPFCTSSDPTGIVDAFIAKNFVQDLDALDYYKTEVYIIPDSREGWGKALEKIEGGAYRRERHKTLVLEFSAIRREGSPIGGMQDRPASGPISLMRAFLNLRNHVIETTTDMPLWEQAMRVDHYFSMEVQVGGARRAARMATKSWRDPGIFNFIRIKSEGGLWTANHSVMVDTEFWNLVNAPTTDDLMSIYAHAVFNEVTRCAYINGEPGFITADKLEDYHTGFARQKLIYTDGRDFMSSRYKVHAASDLLADLAQRSLTCRYPVTTNPCGEICLHVTGGVCVISDYAPVLACPVSFDSFIPGDVPEDVALEWDARVEDSVRLGERFLIRVNTMDALYGEEIKRTNRTGLGPTGLQEYAWMRFGFDFLDLLDDEGVSAPFWALINRFSEAAKEESIIYSAELGLEPPTTVTTVKPAGTTSKLYGLTEGGHLLSFRQLLRWVQFKGEKNPKTDLWTDTTTPLLLDYEAKGYPILPLKTFPGMTAVGFPAVPLLTRLGIGDRAITASEATPEQQYRWLRNLEKYWIGAKRGNQVSYTMKVYTDRYDLEAFREIVRTNQPTIRCCAIMPTKPDHELGYEYLPEEDVPLDRFAEIVSRINDPDAVEHIDLTTLQCASGACPI
jgi:hypothetical protein